LIQTHTHTRARRHVQQPGTAMWVSVCVAARPIKAASLHLTLLFYFFWVVQVQELSESSVVDSSVVESSVVDSGDFHSVLLTSL